MPAWLAAAVRLLVGTTPRALATGTGVGALVGPVLGSLGIPGVDLFPDGRPRRRRRRRALTASDRADIAFIGQPAGRQFAMLIGSRTAS